MGHGLTSDFFLHAVDVQEYLYACEAQRFPFVTPLQMRLGEQWIWNDNDGVLGQII